MNLVEPKIIQQLIQDVGAENTRQFIASLQDEIARRCDNISQAREQQSLSMLNHEAHALKGAALTYGATLLGELLYQMELSAKAGEEDAFALVDEVLKLAQQSRLAYQNLEIKD